APSGSSRRAALVSNFRIESAAFGKDSYFLGILDDGDMAFKRGGSLCGSRETIRLRPKSQILGPIRSAYFYNPVLCLLLINKCVDKVGRNIARQHRRAAQ